MRLKIAPKFEYTSLFYLMICVLLYYKRHKFFKLQESDADNLIWFAKLIPSVIESATSLSIFFCTLLCVCAFNVLYSNKTSRILCGFLVLIFFSFSYSKGKIPHAQHAWIYSVVIMMFYNSKKLLNEGSNFIVLRIIQSTLLLSYFISGTWKVRVIYMNPDVSITEFALRPLALGIAKGDIGQNYASIIHTYQDYIAFGFIGVIIFQISTILPIIFNKFFKTYGVLAIVFHFMTSLTLNITFFSTQVAVFYFLIFSELVKDNLPLSLTKFMERAKEATLRYLRPKNI